MESLSGVDAVSRYDRLESFLFMEVNKVSDETFKEVPEDAKKFVHRHQKPHTQHETVLEKKKNLEVCHHASNANTASFRMATRSLTSLSRLTGSALKRKSRSLSSKTTNARMSDASHTTALPETGSWCVSILTASTVAIDARDHS